MTDIWCYYNALVKIQDAKYLQNLKKTFLTMIKESIHQQCHTMVTSNGTSNTTTATTSTTANTANTAITNTTNNNNYTKLYKRRYNAYIIAFSIMIGASIVRLYDMITLRLDQTSVSSWWNTTTTISTTSTTSSSTNLKYTNIEKKNIHNNHNNDPYHLDLTYLPLLDWEMESLMNRTCNPPPRQQLQSEQQQQSQSQQPTDPNNNDNNIPSYCCIGSMSAGGGIYFAETDCNKGINIYNRTQTLALQQLQNNPIISSSSSSSSIIQCDVCRIVDILIEQNWTMAFQGDSITRQTFFGLECELYRRGYIIIKELLYTPQSKEFWRIGLDEVSELRIYKQEQQQEQQPNDQYATIRLYAMYRPNIVDTVEIQNIVMNNDIIMFDHGLHYGVASDPCFVDQMKPLLDIYMKYFNEYHDVKLFIWRETSAQHFNNSIDGYFIPGIADSTCAPPMDMNYDDNNNNDVDDTTSSTGITNTNRIMNMMQSIIQKDEKVASKLRIIPFYEYTKQLYDLHIDGDCSHFCSSPPLFLPLYRLLRNEMEKIV